MTLDSKGGSAVYASRDGGRSWTRGVKTSDRNAVFDGIDPALAFDSEGNAYFLSIGADTSVWKSTDGGLTWGSRAVVPGSAWDRAWIVCDPSAAPTGRVYVGGKIPVTVFGHEASDIVAVSGSRDRGASFSFPRLLLPAPEKTLLNVVSDMVALPDGRLVLALQTFGPENLRAPVLLGTYQTIVSADGGRSFASPRVGPTFHAYGHADEGKSAYGLGGARMTAGASSKARRGRLHLVWLDAAEGFHHVMAAFSDDAGASWSAPVRVSDSTAGTDQSTPAVAVDGAGVVGIAWYDRRADPSNACYELYFASSTDGGDTFSANRRIDGRRTCPLPPSTDGSSSVYRFKNGGDTLGMVGLPGGGFQLAWIGADSHEMQLVSTVTTAQ